MIKKTVRQTLKIAGAGIIALVIISIFYNYSGVYAINPTGATDYVWESRQWKATMAEGHSWQHLDENGFANLSVPNRVDILLMGSSHMEAVNIPIENNVGGIKPADSRAEYP